MVTPRIDPRAELRTGARRALPHPPTGPSGAAFPIETGSLFAIGIINRVDAAQVSQSHAGQSVTIGLDIGKYRVFAVARWPDAQFERPWRVANPEQLPDFLALVRQLSTARTRRWWPNWPRWARRRPGRTGPRTSGSKS